MSIQRTPMTREGHTRLTEELDRLKRVERPSITKAIAEARAHGDLSENAEYHAAREQQGFIEGRIKEIEHKLANAEVIEPRDLPHTGKVVFGAVVELEDQADGTRVEYQVVGEDEANIRAGRISVSSPIARALVGKEEGEIVEVAAPGGTRSYEIVTVRFE
jgi:transcription elongation factor GreA